MNGHPVIRVRLKDVLDERGMSQRQLARLIGKQRETVSKFARQATGGVSYELLALICEALRCEPGVLLKFEAEQPSLFPSADRADHMIPRAERTTMEGRE